LINFVVAWFSVEKYCVLRMFIILLDGSIENEYQIILASDV
jgi:hypothetical protein